MGLSQSVGPRERASDRESELVTERASMWPRERAWDQVIHSAVSNRSEEAEEGNLRGEKNPLGDKTRESDPPKGRKAA